ncbi:MAG TPA: hypothetical protein VF247_02480 [Candidatus Krumholzibacteria bacterium]
MAALKTSPVAAKAGDHMMRKSLLLTVSLLFICNAALAADYIGVFTDHFNGVCDLAPGFSTTATVVHYAWTPGGATGARFKVLPPPGSVLLGFTTPYVTIGSIDLDLSVAYGGCEQFIAIGTITANWAVGYGQVVGADGQPCLMTADCSFDEQCAKGGIFSVGHPPGGCGVVATEHSTWGKVKSLYR